MTDQEREALRNQPEWREFEKTVEETLAKHREDVVKPYRSALVWFGVLYIVLLGLSVAQAVMYWTTP